jgi:hypothetical protein
VSDCEYETGVYERKRIQSGEEPGDVPLPNPDEAPAEAAERERSADSRDELIELIAQRLNLAAQALVAKPDVAPAECPYAHGARPGSLKHRTRSSVASAALQARGEAARVGESD